jgi:hypothetical protein
MEIEDDGNVRPREPAAEQHRGRLVRALDEHRIRLELAQLAGHSARQRGVERNPVEPSRAHGPGEVEPVVALGRVLGRARQHAQLELVPERRELAPQRPVERENVAPAGDEQ